MPGDEGQIRRRIRRRWWAAAALLLFLSVMGGADGGGVAHASTLTTQAGKSSCVATGTGVTSGAGSINFATNVTKTLRFRCYYDWDAVPVWAVGFGGTTNTWFDGEASDLAFANQAGNAMDVIIGGACNYASKSATTGMSYTNVAVQATDPAIGFVEFSVDWTWKSGGSINMTHAAASTEVTVRFGTYCNGPDSSTRGVGGGHQSTPTSATGCYAMSCGTISETDYDGGTFPAMRWGDEYSDADPFCGAVVTTTSSALGSVRPGDSISFTSTGVPLHTGSISIAWGPVTGIDEDGYRWATWTPLFEPASTGSPVTVVSVVGPSSEETPLLGTRWLRCYDLLEEQWKYRQVSSASLGVPSTSRPCSLARWHFPTVRNVVVDELVRFSLSYQGELVPASQSDDLTISYLTYDDQNDPLPPIQSGTVTWTTLATITTKPTFVDYDMEAVYGSSTLQWVFRCTDHLGTTYDPQWTTGVRTVPGDFDGEDVLYRDQSCMSGAGLSLHPSTWLPAAGKMGSCLTKALFVPRQESLEALYASANAATEKAPIAFVAQTGDLIYGTMDGAADSVTANRAGCLTLLPAVALPALTDEELGEQEVCPADLSSSGLSTMRDVVGAGFWVGFAWLCWAITRRLFSQ